MEVSVTLSLPVLEASFKTEAPSILICRLAPLTRRVLVLDWRDVRSEVRGDTISDYL
jgi:hypothetical protein